MDRRDERDGWDAGCLVETRGLSKRYPRFELCDVSIKVEAGSVVGLVGRNGSGKSTILKCLLGLIRADGGSARVLGIPAPDLGRSAGAEVKELVGVVFDTLPFPGTLKVERVGSVMGRAFRAWDAEGFRRRVAGYGIPLEAACKELSRGMGMKLQLACALSHGARLLVLDEPTAGLDPLARDEALDELRLFMEGEGRSVLMSSHITTDLEKVADVVYCIDEGRMVFGRPKDEICDAMGAARVREGDLGALRESGLFPDGALRVLAEPGRGMSVLVEDYYAFRRALPEVACERLSIEGYMAFMLKGELR